MKKKSFAFFAGSKIDAVDGRDGLIIEHATPRPYFPSHFQ
jgi:hypothetical protein